MRNKKFIIKCKLVISCLMIFMLLGCNNQNSFTNDLIDIEEKLEEANYLIEKNQCIKASEILLQLPDNKNNPKIFETWGYYYLRLYKLKEAKEMYAKSLQLDPTNDAALASLADAYSLNGEYEKATFLLDEAIKINPQSSKHYYLYGDHYRRKNDISNATHFFEKAIEKGMRKDVVFAQMGWAYFDVNDLAKSGKKFNESLKQNSTYDMAIIGLGSIYAKLGFLELSKRQYYKSIKINPLNILPYEELKKYHNISLKRPIE